MLNIFSSEVSPQFDHRRSLEELYSERELRSSPSGAPIQMKPEEIWIVCRGVVQLSTLHPSGDEVLVGFAGPAMPFGVSLSSLKPYFATALSNVDLLRLTLADLQDSADLSQGIFRQLGRRLGQTEAILAIVGHRRVEERLSHLLRLLQVEVGQPVEGGTRLTIKLTHQQLANAIGTTRVTVTRLLSKFRNEQWIKLDKTRHIIVMSDQPVHP